MSGTTKKRHLYFSFDEELDPEQDEPCLLHMTISPERCADCGFTAPEHEQARIKRRFLLAAPETSREGSGRPEARDEEDDIPFEEPAESSHEAMAAAPGPDHLRPQ